MNALMCFNFKKDDLRESKRYREMYRRMREREEWDSEKERE